MNQIWGHIWLLSLWIICGRQNLEDSASQMEEDEEMYRRFSLIKDMKVRVTGYLIAFSSVAQSCPTLCDPMNHSAPGLPVHHQLPEFPQTYVHQVGDAIQPSHPRSSPSPPAPNPAQHQDLSNESTLRTRWPKYWSFSFSISPSSGRFYFLGLQNHFIQWLQPWN